MLVEIRNFILDPTKLPLVILHIIAVLIYATWRKWGKISLFGKMIALPGGAVPISFPVWELLAVLWFGSKVGPTEMLIYAVAGHMLRVRVILLVFSILPAWFGGKLFCMDHRTWKTADSLSERSLANHGGACGGFITLTFWGLFPLLAIFGVMSAFGISVPVNVAYLGMFPFFFLFSKHIKIPAVGTIADFFGWTELPGWLMACLYTFRKIEYQRCHYH